MAEPRRRGPVDEDWSWISVPGMTEQDEAVSESVSVVQLEGVLYVRVKRHAVVRTVVVIESVSGLPVQIFGAGLSLDARRAVDAHRVAERLES